METASTIFLVLLSLCNMHISYADKPSDLSPGRAHQYHVDVQIPPVIWTAMSQGVLFGQRLYLRSIKAWSICYNCNIWLDVLVHMDHGWIQPAGPWGHIATFRGVTRNFKGQGLMVISRTTGVILIILSEVDAIGFGKCGQKAVNSWIYIKYPIKKQESQPSYCPLIASLHIYGK